MKPDFKNQNLWMAFNVACSGVFLAVAEQKHFRIHALCAVLAIGMGIFTKITAVEWSIVFSAIFFVIITELLNSAIEKTVDLVTADYHILAKQAKDIAAGAVLMSCIYAILMAYLLFFDTIGHYIFGGLGLI